MKNKNILKGIFFISILLVTTIYFKYRTQNFPVGLEAMECLASVAVLILSLIFLFIKKKTLPDNFQKKNIQLGIYFGLLWTVEISMNNFIQPKLPLRDNVDDIFWGIIALLILITAVYYSYQTRKISTAVYSGFWTGFASGTIACFTALLLIVFGMKLILTDPPNISEWYSEKATSDTNSMATYFAYQTLAGAMMHLIILGVIMGLLLGAIGGCISKLAIILNKKSL